MQMAGHTAEALKDEYRRFLAAVNTRRQQWRKSTWWHYSVRLPMRIVFGTLGLLALAILMVMRPLVRVRVGKLCYERIGHLGPNTELYLRRRSQRKETHREWHLFVTGEPANRQLLTMIRRRVPVTENRLFLRVYDAVHPWTEGAETWIDLPMNFNEYEEFNTIPPQLAFTPEEEMKGRQLLAGMGIEPGTPFICFHTRDSTYLDTVLNRRSRAEWAYHDYRDSNIANYLSAATYLAELGCFALRMGHIVKDRLPTPRHKRVIDYACEFRSDFGDIYLLAHCKFFLCQHFGPCFLASCFNVPVAAANFIPLRHTPLGSKDLFIPKKLWDISRKRLLTFRKILACGADDWRKAQRYTQAGIEVIENTSEEILALAREMNERLDGTWITTAEDEELQQRYRALFPPGHPISGYPSRVGAEFLRQHRELLE